MKKSLYCLALFALFAALFCACEKKDIKTAYVFAPGQTLNYRLWVNQQIESDGDVENAVRVSMRTDFKLKAVSVAPDGTADLEVLFTGASASATVGEKRNKLEVDKTLVNRTITLKMKPNGEIPDLLLPKVEDPSQYSSLTRMQHIIMDMFTTLPQNLSNGTAWTRKTFVQEELGSLGTVSTETKTSFVAGSEVEVWQQRATEISVNFDVRLGSEVEKEHKNDSTPKDGEPQSMLVSGGGSGSGKMYFDLQRNVCVGAAYETDVNMKSELIFDNAERNISRNQKIKTGIVLKLIPENAAK